MTIDEVILALNRIDSNESNKEAINMAINCLKGFQELENKMNNISVSNRYVDSYSEGFASGIEFSVKKILNLLDK